MTDINPPPWKLRGWGAILLYRFERDFVAEQGFVPPDMLPNFVGGFGAVMLIDYRQSPVGPYRELLFIPGQFKQGRRRYYSITKIYVSTEASLVNGRANWGIPKELAQFSLEQIDNRQTHFTATPIYGSTPFFTATIEAGILRTPFNTVVSPRPARLLQRSELGRWLETMPRAGGTISLTGGLTDIAADPDFFPDVREQRPIGVFDLPQFRMTFPIPKTVEGAG